MIANKLEAIETVYRGFRFRSRLEARWAVFFDAIRLEWRYEHEGFKLPVGWYLPDFWFPEIQMFGEVKPGPFTPKQRRLVQYLVEASCHAVIELVDVPACQTYKAWWWRGHIGPDIAADWIRWNDGHAYWLKEGRLFEQPDFEECKHAGTLSVYSSCETCEAVRVARSARFEYGEERLAAAEAARLGEIYEHATV